MPGTEWLQAPPRAQESGREGSPPYLAWLRPVGSGLGPCHWPLEGGTRLLTESGHPGGGAGQGAAPCPRAQAPGAGGTTRGEGVALAFPGFPVRPLSAQCFLPHLLLTPPQLYREVRDGLLIITPTSPTRPGVWIPQSCTCNWAIKTQDSIWETGPSGAFLDRPAENQTGVLGIRES